MAKDKVISVKSDEDIADRIDHLVEKEGITKGELLASMVTDREQKSLGVQMPERMGDIKAFEESVERMKILYKSSLEIAKSADERAVERVKMKIETHVQTIADLQKERDELEKELAQTVHDYKDKIDECTRLYVEINRLNDRIAEKDNVISEKDAMLKTQSEMISMLQEVKTLLEKKTKEK